MVLMNGLKALPNPTRLRVLELLKSPAAFQGSRGDDGRPVGMTAKARRWHLRCAHSTLSGKMHVLPEE